MLIALQALLVPLFWSLVFPLSKIVMRSLPPLTIAALRYTLGAALLTAIALLRGGRAELARLLRRQWPAMFALGAAATVSNAAQVVGLRWASAATGAIIGATSPVYAAALAALFLRERLGAAQVAGLLLALAGACGIALAGPASGDTTPAGALLMFVGAISYSVYTVLGKHYEATSLPVLAASTRLGVLPLLAAALVLERPWRALSAAGAAAWAGLVALAALPTALAVIWFFTLVARIGATRASLILYLVPVFGLVQSRLLLGERITPALLIGGLASVGGVALAQLGPRRGRHGQLAGSAARSNT